MIDRPYDVNDDWEVRMIDYPENLDVGKLNHLDR